MLLLTGALTSKLYAFTSRPWELRSVQSIDILDGIGSNIRIDFKETEIVRILPRKNPDINENWISDKIRFFYDGLKRQRLINPYVKVNGDLKPFKWIKTLNKVSSLFKVFAFEYGLSKIGVLAGSSVDCETLFTLKNLSQTYGFSNLGVDETLNIDIDNPSAYKFQKRMPDLDNIDYCLLIGTNPRFEGSILNLRLRKIYRKGNFCLDSIGGTFSSTFPINFLGLSTTTLLSVVEGKHPICKVMAKAKNPVILLGSSVLHRFDGVVLSNIIQFISNSFFKIFKKKLDINILHTGSNIVGAFELGFRSLKKDDIKEMKLLYGVGLENSDVFAELKQVSSSSVLILQNSTGNYNTLMGDLILPSTSFIENSGVFYNTEGRPQKTQRAFIGPNLSRDNWKIVTIIQQLLGFRTHATKAQLNTEISKILPSFFFADSWFNTIPLISGSMFSFLGFYREKLLKSSLKLSIEDFFMTHSLCKASKVMAKASVSLRSYTNNYKFLSSMKN